MNLTIRQRLLGQLGIVSVGLIALIVVFALSYRSEMIAQTRTGLANYVENAYTIIESYAKRAEAGEMTEDAAKQQAIDAVMAMRYGGSGYLWIHNLDDIMIAHPLNPGLVGKNLANLEDAKGDKFFLGMNDVIRNNNGSGYYTYYWAKPGEAKDKSFPKESYVRLFRPWGYVIGTGVYIDDLNAKIFNTVLFVGAMALAVLAVVGFLAVMISRSINKPLARIKAAMLQLADGRTDIELDDAHMPPDIKEMADTVVVFRDNAVERQALRDKQDAEQNRRLERQRRVEELIQIFQGSSEEALAAVGDYMDQVQNSAKALAGIAESTSTQATGAAGASDEASNNVQTVAAASEELAASISEISSQVGRTNQIVDVATSSTEAANEKVAALAEAAQKIGDVVNLIQDIAEQTNLLALNATIEAARAGEMGKGFAVVASEVKTLANQTAKATEEIGSQIAFVQESTREAVEAIEGIAKTMVDVNGYTSSIAAAVEEQGAATNEISRNAGEAASGTLRVAQNMSGVMERVAETNQSADQVEQLAREAAGQANNLRTAVSDFLQKIAAA
ncbi:methyl-accepting chemotaxis protein [Rhodobium gokarnense]|uniref:Methyl-accepting chemotaxis protein n=1 Tax=Rhodobium gokarnense TaxID=364296 RepID=A0ABT3HI94_9HYPH|nr:cache domain-containing protein [Rhodobium gokarnense]MCW2310119.1 methyl-accepting chemotaxis protein [Rhodobium gokarnense]